MYINEIIGPTICTHGKLIGKPIIRVVLSTNSKTNSPKDCENNINMSGRDVEKHIIELGHNIPEYAIYISSVDKECLSQQKELTELIEHLAKNQETYNRTVCIETQGFFKPTSDILSQYNLFWSICVTKNTKIEKIREIVTSSPVYELVFEITQKKKNCLSEDEIKDIVYKLSILDLTINNNIFVSFVTTTNFSLGLLLEATEMCFRNGWNVYPTLPFNDYVLQRTINSLRLV